MSAHVEGTITAPSAFSPLTFPAPSTSNVITSWLGIPIPVDFNGLISLQIISLTGTTPGIIVEVSNREMMPLSQQITSSQPYTGAQTTWISTGAEWSTIQLMNVLNNTFQASFTAAGIYVGQAFAYRSLRARLNAGTPPVSADIVLGYAGLP